MGLICSSEVCTTCPACPCCGFSTEAMVRQEIKDILKSWMKRLTDLAPETKLRNLAMMASHDCGTYSISKSKLGSSISRTQSIDVYEQLDLGVRQIDFRYGPTGKNPDDLSIRHGPHSGSNYFRELIKVKNWVEDNPYEFLILDARCEKKVSQEQRDHLVQFLLEKFGKVMITKEDTNTWFKVGEVSLGDLLKNHPRRVLLLVDGMIKDSPAITDSPKVKDLLHRDDFLNSPWHNTASIKKLFTGVEKDAYDMIVNKPNCFFNHQLILTPKTKLTHITKYCICMDRGRIDQKQYLLFQEKKVQNFIREFGAQSKVNQFNFLMMDFINYDPLIIQYLIGLNFPSKLEIESATLVVSKKSHDVLNATRSLISRENSLWIVSASKDLGIKFKKAELHLVYKYGTGSRVHKKIELHSHDQYLLNCFSHLDVTLDITETAPDITKDFERRRTEMFHDTDHDLVQAIDHKSGGTQKSSMIEESLHHMCSPLIPDLQQSFASFTSLTCSRMSSKKT